MQKVLFADVHNAGRSQMAAAWFNALADPGKARALSAGTAPSERLHPDVLAAMAEIGIDLSDAEPQVITEDLAASATLLVTMDCGEACPQVPGLARDEWPVPESEGRPIDEVRAIRDEIGRRVGLLVRRCGWGRPLDE